MLDAVLHSLRALYLKDQRPWLVGFSGGKDSALVAQLIFETLSNIPSSKRTKNVAVVCTDTCVEIPAIAETIKGTLTAMQKYSDKEQLGITTHLLRPPPEQSFWVNMLGRGYPPPNRMFRWCTQRLKIDPVTTFIKQTQRHGRSHEAILHLGARRAESSTRS